jgi:hypothetical protein
MSLEEENESLLHDKLGVSTDYVQAVGKLYSSVTRVKDGLQHPESLLASTAHGRQFLSALRARRLKVSSAATANVAKYDPPIRRRAPPPPVSGPALKVYDFAKLIQSNVDAKHTLAPSVSRSVILPFTDDVLTTAEEVVVAQDLTRKEIQRPEELTRAERISLIEPDFSEEDPMRFYPYSILKMTPREILKLMLSEFPRKFLFFSVAYDAVDSHIPNVARRAMKNYIFAVGVPMPPVVVFWFAALCMRMIAQKSATNRQLKGRFDFLGINVDKTSLNSLLYGLEDAKLLTQSAPGPLFSLSDNESYSKMKRTVEREIEAANLGTTTTLHN